MQNEVPRGRRRAYCDDVCPPEAAAAAAIFWRGGGAPPRGAPGTVNPDVAPFFTSYRALVSKKKTKKTLNYCNAPAAAGRATEPQPRGSRGGGKYSTLNKSSASFPHTNWGVINHSVYCILSLLCIDEMDGTV